ncbi:MAG TPA: EAL domain-containing protein [Thermoanaerobaculia bacterium]|nr:EAL domain-containing protein [Thermoanaerobaculia bacterium]
MGKYFSLSVLPKSSDPSPEPDMPFDGDLRLSFTREVLPLADPVSASGERLRLLVERMPAVLWTTDRELRFSSAGLPAFGFEELAGTSLYDYYGTRDPESLPIRAHRLALEGESVSFEQHWEGRIFQTRVEPLRDGSGEITGCLGIAVDMTERKRAEEALRREKERAQVTLASIGDGVIRTEPDGTIDYLNPVAEKLTGWTNEKAVGRPVSEVFRVIDEMTRKPLPDPIKRCLDEKRVVESPGHVLLISAEGKEYSVRDSAAPIYDRDGGLALGAVVVFKDVTQLRGMEREMIYLASHDPLTGLINRREFEVRLKRAIRGARGERRHHVLLYLDLDEFKVVNDTCGHLVGDEMLKQITALLRSRVRRSDILARLGGDEFGVLLEDCPLDHARQIAEEMRRTVREFRFCWRDQIFEVGVSIGLVPINSDSGDLNHVMSAADAACYVAKDSGRNRVHEYELDDTLVAERYGEMQWIHRIHRAFEDRRFRLFYQLIQPISPDVSRDLLCEVFIRMLDRNGKVIEPSAFIAAAERYHLIGSLDRWVVKTAFGALAEAQKREWSRPVLFAINLSGMSLSEESFLTFVVEELEKSSVDSRRICFEITETAAISKLDSAMRFISVLKTKGCRFILDDFGSGLSSFAYLRDLQVDFLKIDGEFVKDMMEDRVKRAMVESINQIGHVMGIQTIAEWVENRQTLEALKEMGVDYAQGYWLCRPQPLVHEP